MVVRATVDGSAVRRAIAELKEIDPKLVTALRRDIKSELSGVASGIEASLLRVTCLALTVWGGLHIKNLQRL